MARYPRLIEKPSPLDIFFYSRGSDYLVTLACLPLGPAWALFQKASMPQGSKARAPSVLLMGGINMVVGLTVGYNRSYNRLVGYAENGKELKIHEENERARLEAEEAMGKKSYGLSTKDIKL